MKRMMFFRDYHGLSGGHLIVFNYFMDTLRTGHFVPSVYFTPQSLPLSQTPWASCAAQVDVEWHPDQADALFLGGLDWNAVPIELKCPVVNLIQHVRHTDPDDPRAKFLERRAIRIAVSEEVADALRRSRRCNGPIVTILNTVNPAELPPPKPMNERKHDVVISGLKNPEFAIQLGRHLTSAGLKAIALTEQIDRMHYLETIADGRISLLLPCHREGFYLPAIESMVLGCLVVCPDCIGNRSFCIHGTTAIVPPYTLLAIASDVIDIWRNQRRLVEISSAGATMAMRYYRRPQNKPFEQILQNLISFR